MERAQFTVYENGEKQTVNVFRQDDVPISLGLIIDTSASMTDKRDRVASAALAMVKASNPEDEVFIINFNESAVLARDFTNNIKDLEKALRNLDAKGETAMRDALLLGIEHLRHRAHRDKKVLLVVTDGEDNSSVETQAHLVEVAQQNDVIIYAIGLLGAEEPDSAARAKKQLNELTAADRRAVAGFRTMWRRSPISRPRLRTKSAINTCWPIRPRTWRPTAASARSASRWTCPGRWSARDQATTRRNRTGIPGCEMMACPAAFYGN